MERYEVFRLFGGETDDYSDEALEEMYLWESRGLGNLKEGLFSDGRRPNGFASGKKWMEVTVCMWKEDIKKGLLLELELYQLKRYPIWWLDEIFK